MRTLLLRWLISAASIVLVAWLLPGIDVGSGTPGVVTALVGGGLLGVLNLIVKPVLVLLSCPLVLLSLGLFLFVINAAVLLLASNLSQRLGYPFHVDGWLTAIFGSILITIVSWLLHRVLDDKKKREDK